MMFDGWVDDIGGVIRTKVLRRMSLQIVTTSQTGPFTTEIGLHGPFYQVPDWLYFRRDHPERAERAHLTVRTWCTNLDPRRADRLRHPTVRLYAEYVWGYVAAIRRAPLSPADRRECYRHLAQWAAGRALPVTGRAVLGGAPRSGHPTASTDCNLSSQSTPSWPAGEEAFVTLGGLTSGRERSVAVSGRPVRPPRHGQCR